MCRSCHGTRDRVDFEQSFRYRAATGLTCSIFPASGDRLPTDPRPSPYVHLMSHLCIVIITILLFAPIIINIIVVLLANVLLLGRTIVCCDRREHRIRFRRPRWNIILLKYLTILCRVDVRVICNVATHKYYIVLYFPRSENFISS